MQKEGGAIFCIASEDYKDKINQFLSNDFTNNSVIKFSETYVNSSKFKESFLETVIANRQTSYDFNRILYANVKNSCLKWASDYPKLLFKNLKKDFDFFEDKKVLYLAGGPSLEKNLPWIKENQDKFIIATIGATYATLLKNDIKVDIIFTLDGMYKYLKEKQFSDENISLLSDELIFASMISDDRILKDLKKENIFLYETYFSFCQDNFDIPSTSVGEMGLALLLLFNVKEIYLLGLDMALEQSSGLSHSSFSNSGVKQIDLNSDKLGKSSSLDKEVLSVKGNLQEEVKTHIVFKSSIDCIQSILQDKQSDVNIYNLSQDGAYFYNTKPTQIQDINIKKFKNISFDKKIFKEKLKKYTKKTLDEKEKNILLNQAIYLEKVVKEQLLVLDKDKSKNLDKFILSNSSLFSSLMKENDSIYAIIFSNYFNILLNFLSLKFNDKDLKDEKNKLKNIKKLIKKDIEDISNDIIFYLKGKICH